ncbi:glyoxylate/hydroxypyruvate reductase A [Marinomonas sp. 15G1-11]|uniref:Glyoxylate/hydroxypyruvate reductase A n=1 Tax=Marinomonas phaeophyticola TaxID=3004091 RepID=A0ABT4JYQ3_9GAMM|nr:glyoxylate/hydroxypyruvate reductase A [Marinomonas sp. 15G1-11]MCZ2723454.1 glyoxylate/hydroxypyruvate reductase A [Marinomonas sp. 15G1-11]
MSSIVFIHNMDAHNQDLWLKRFDTLLLNETLVLPETLSDSQAANIELAIVANPNPEVLKRFPNLIWVQSLWAGVESMVKSFRALNVNKSSDQQPTQLVRLIDPYLAKTMAEAVLTWSLYLYRNIPSYINQQSQKVWRPIPCPAIETIEVSVLGTGELGIASMNALIHQGFTVNSWSRTPKKMTDVAHYSGAEGLVTLLNKTDILICLLPLTDATHQLINKDTLSLLPKGAKLINFARGGIINHNDLMAALDEHHLSHAVLDVFEQEPLNRNSPLWSHPNISILPHISASTNIDTASKIVADNILRYRQDGTIPTAVDLSKGY